MLIVLLLQGIRTQQLKDSISVNGDASALGKTPKELNDMFNSSRRVTDAGLSIGQSQTVYMRWFSYDGISSDDIERSYTAGFSVTVDEYSQLTIPSSIESNTGIDKIIPKSPSGNAYRNISLYYVQNSKNGTKPICDLATRRMWYKSGATDFVVPFRTVLFQLQQGQVKGCDWAPSKCVLDPNSYDLDSICAPGCPGGSCKTNITLFVAWTGTDANGKPLQSYSKDVYRLKNAF